jgi:predicted metalloprotease with PDZ domain
MKKSLLYLTIATILPTSLWGAMPLWAQNNAQTTISAPIISAPSAMPIIDLIPSAKDIPYPGIMDLKVDATNINQAIIKVNQTIPVVKSGRMTLLFPKWLPGKHAPRGAVEKLAGLKIYGNGKRIDWVRDTLDVHAFNLIIPEGVANLEIEFQYLSPTAPNQGRIEVTQEMLSLQWNSVSLYPAGYFVRNIPINASVKLPKNWQAATALRPQNIKDDTIQYQTVSYEVLVDSPLIAGKYFKSIPLSDKVSLNIIADAPKYLEFKPEQIELHKKLVEQAKKTFGTEHYDHYDFLFSLSDNLGGIGLEHHRSSENGVESGYFTDWNNSLSARGLLPHEFVHSWDGKFRRGQDAWTPDYRTPMQNSLLWVYEGQTQFWGYVLGARSGLYAKEQTLEAFASIAADLNARKGREWRDLIDTTNDPIITPRAPKAWASYQRSEDYYNEGMLVWIEIDAKLRELSKGKKGIDDFAKAFFGLKDGDYGQITYEFEDIVKTLNKIMPYEWKSLLQARLYEHADGAPLNGFSASGYKLTFNDKPNLYLKDVEGRGKFLNLSYSLGMNIANDGAINGVLWGGMAFDNGLAVSDKVIAINGRAWSKDAAIEEINNAKSTKEPIQLIVLADNRYKIVNFDYHDGIRYPHFEKSGSDGALDKLLAPL